MASWFCCARGCTSAAQGLKRWSLHCCCRVCHVGAAAVVGGGVRKEVLQVRRAAAEPARARHGLRSLSAAAEGSSSSVSVHNWRSAQNELLPCALIFES